MFLGYLFFACKVLQIRHTCTHILKHVSLGLGCASKTWSPPLGSPWFLLGGRPAGVVCVANRAEAQGCDQGTSLLKGSCNFHSRVLLKLVLRSALSEDPLPLLLSPSLDTPTSLLLRLQPDGSLYLFKQAPSPPPAPLYLHWEGVAVCWSVCVHVWPLIFQITRTQQTKIFWLLKNIDCCGYGVYFFLHIIHGWASLLYTISKIFTSQEKSNDFCQHYYQLCYSDLIHWSKSGRASLFSKATSILMAATRGRWFTISPSTQLFTVDQSSHIMLLTLHLHR